MNSSTDERKRRIQIELSPDEDGYPPFKVEGLWAELVDEDVYIVDNIPFYAYGLSSGDAVRVVSKDGQDLWIDSVVRPSGNSVFRISVEDEEERAVVRSELLQLGCSSEIDAKMGIIAFEVPVTRSIAPVLTYLVEGKDIGRFDFEEGVLRHDIPE